MTWKMKVEEVEVEVLQGMKHGQAEGGAGGSLGWEGEVEERTCPVGMVEEVEARKWELWRVEEVEGHLDLWLEEEEEGLNYGEGEVEEGRLWMEEVEELVCAAHS